jgi:hypothetical protein
MAHDSANSGGRAVFIGGVALWLLFCWEFAGSSGVAFGHVLAVIGAVMIPILLLALAIRGR